MKHISKKFGFLPIITFLFVLSFTFAAPAQRSIGSRNLKGPLPLPDTSINPHDFTDPFYADNGVAAKEIIGRRNGADFLSVIGWSSNPNHTKVRVVATLPAYIGETGMGYWYPLGMLNDGGFTGDKAGLTAWEIAQNSPIYIFPSKYAQTADLFGGNRQAALIAKSGIPLDNPLGLRMIVRVDYTAVADGKDAFEVMQAMAKKNGFSLDGTPVIRSVQDMAELTEYGCISTKSLTTDSYGMTKGRYALAPLIHDPTKGVIARDAFLLMVTKTGKPLFDEEFVSNEFTCLQKSADWCVAAQ